REAMSEKIFLPDEIDRLDEGEEIYRRKLKKKLEPKYNGKIIAIEVESGKYFIGDTLGEAGDKARAVFPDKIFFFMRIGPNPAVYKKRW
ncbi:MAG: hypothetical protein ACRENG_18590, partial [bacterium]